jgi:ERCC4-type nuclease
MKNIENIFSKSKPKETCPNPNTQIIVDTREKNSMILSHLHQLKANLIQQKLEVGDYIIGDLIIERKTTTDLINSLKTNHLHIQINNLKQYPSTLLILEKNPLSQNLSSKNCSPIKKGNSVPEGWVANRNSNEYSHSGFFANNSPHSHINPKKLQTNLKKY